MLGTQASLVNRLASSIVTVLDTVVKLYNDVGSASDVPDAFVESARLLPVIRDAVQTVQTGTCTNGTDDEARKELQSTLQRCMERALQLEIVFRKVVPQARTSRRDRYLLSTQTSGKDSRVETLVKEMLEDVKLLAESPVVRPGMEAEAEKLARVIERVSTLTPPTLEDASEELINNCGSGTINANTGSGTANINSSSGQQYIAQNQSFYCMLEQHV
jgi:hypothetical protein